MTVFEGEQTDIAANMYAFHDREFVHEFVSARAHLCDALHDQIYDADLSTLDEQTHETQL